MSMEIMRLLVFTIFLEVENGAPDTSAGITSSGEARLVPSENGPIFSQVNCNNVQGMKSMFLTDYGSTHAFSQTAYLKTRVLLVIPKVNMQRSCLFLTNNSNSVFGVWGKKPAPFDGKSPEICIKDVFELSRWIPHAL